jgi:hypothetical protein
VGATKECNTRTFADGRRRPAKIATRFGQLRRRGDLSGPSGIGGPANAPSHVRLVFASSCLNTTCWVRIPISQGVLDGPTSRAKEIARLGAVRINRSYAHARHYMSKVCFSYRRSDSQEVVGRLYDKLAAHFGREQLFRDLDDIPLSVPFPEFVRSKLQRTKAVLVVMGTEWIDATDADGRRRLDDPDDFVRVEVETALSLPVAVIPVTVSNASIPPKRALPESLKRLTDHAGLAVRPDPDFHHDTNRLIRHLESLGIHPLKTSETTSKVQPKPNRARHLVTCVLILLVLALFVSQLPQLLFRGTTPTDGKPEARSSNEPLPELSANLTLNYGHMYVAETGLAFMAKPSPESSNKDDGLPAIQLSIVNTANREIMFSWPTINFAAGSSVQAMGFPMNMDDLRGGTDRVRLGPGLKRDFPLCYGLMSSDFDFFLDEFLAGRVSEIFVQSPDGRRTTVPRSQIADAASYFQKHFKGRDLSSIVGRYKEYQKAGRP